MTLLEYILVLFFEIDTTIDTILKFSNKSEARNFLNLILSNEKSAFLNKCIKKGKVNFNILYIGNTGTLCIWVLLHPTMSIFHNRN